MKGVSFNSEFNTIINQFNAKVKQLKNQGMKYLPEEVDKKTLSEIYKYDQVALKRKLSDLQRFLEKDAERIVTLDGGAKTTAWEYDSIKREAKANKTYLTKEISRYGKITPTVYGKEQDATYAQMGDATYENYKKMRESLNKAKFSSQQDWTRYKDKNRNLTKRRLTQDYVFKENYKDFLLLAGFKGDIDPDLVNEVIDLIDQMDADEFYDLYQVEESLQDITDKYNTMKILTGNFSDEDVKNLQDDFEFLAIYLKERNK